MDVKTEFILLLHVKHTSASKIDITSDKSVGKNLSQAHRPKKQIGIFSPISNKADCKPKPIERGKGEHFKLTKE